MPRTKRPIRKKEKPVEDDTIKKVVDIVADLKKRLDIDAEMECQQIELAFKMLLKSIEEADLQKTVGQLRCELHLKEVTNTTTRRSSTRRSATSRDDGSVSSSRKTERRPRSASASASASVSSASSRRAPPAAGSARRRSRSVYHTPAYNKNASANYPLITPKVAPHAPLTVLRQPRQGEMVVSMSGSPVMVPAVYTMQPDDKANCNILLKDGTMLSLQPKQLRTSQAFIPFSLMDAGVMRQLKTLKDNLEKVVKLSEIKV